jgi:hypothetical protein
MPKIVLIGAGIVIWTRRLTYDVLSAPELALPEAEVRRVLALWGERARTGGAELRVQD